MACSECENEIPCEEGDNTCNCVAKDQSTDCSTYTGDDLPCTGIKKNTILTTVIQSMDAFICNKFDEAIQYLTLLNIGAGAKIYKGITGIGNKEIRTIEQGDDILVTEEVDTIKISNPPATELIKGVAEIATQVEADAGTDDERYITSLKMAVFVANPVNLPDATESVKGIAEVATQTEANALSADDKIITPAKLPISAEAQQGIIQIATQVEADAGTNDTKSVTPLKMAVFVADPTNLPDATESVKGIAEVATQAEADALSLDDKIITPAKLPITSETQQGLIELATQAEVDAESDAVKAVTPATLAANLAAVLADPTNLPSATEIAEGVAEIATQAEVDTGTDDVRFVTPLKLKSITDGLPGVQNLMSGTADVGNIDGTPTGSLTVTGDITTATKTNPGSNYSEIAVVFPTIGTTVYDIIVNINDQGSSTDVKGWTYKTKTATGFILTFSEEAGSSQDLLLQITCLG